MESAMTKTSDNWTRENLAWMAGLFEGEGYVQGRPRSYFRKDGRKFTSVGFRAVITMTDEDVLLRFQSLAGIGTLRGPRVSPSRSNNKPLWDYSTYGADAYALLVAMFGWLGERRQTQAHSAMLAWIDAPGHWSRKTQTD